MRERAYSNVHVSLWLISILTPCTNAEHYGGRPREGVELGAFVGRSKTRARTPSKSPRGFLGARRCRRQHHCCTSALLLSNSVEKRRIFVPRKGWLSRRNLGRDVRMGSFLSNTRFVHFVTTLLFLLTLMILPLFPFVRISVLIFFSSHLFPLHCQCFLIRSFTVSPHLLHLWDYHE